MRLYRAMIRPVVSFSSQLQSDTFFGAFCWSYKYLYGEEKMEELLKEMRYGNPQVIFSNAFPTGTLPMPLGIYDTAFDFEKIENKEERKKAYQNRKKLKSARYVTREWFEQIRKGHNRGFTSSLSHENMQEQTVMHNMVSRLSGTVEKTDESDESGNLYEEDEFFVQEGTRYDVYVLSDLDEEVLKKTIQMMCMLGIGRKKSTGKGAFELADWKEERFDDIEANAFVALSNFVPAQTDPTDGRYKILVKYGKLDREYASEEIPFKKPIVFLQAGAVFRDEVVKPWYGRCMEQISAKEGVVTNAYTISVPIRLN